MVGAVILDVTCFAEAERLYMLARDTAVHGRPLTALVLPDVLHTKLPPDCCPLLVFVNPKSGGLKGRELLCSFRKLLNPHQVFELTNGGPLPGFHLFSQVPSFRVLVVWWRWHRWLGARCPGGDKAPSGLSRAICGHLAPGYRE